MRTDAGGLTKIGGDALHVAIDVQRMFAETTDWQVPTLDSVVPQILALANGHRSSTVFTRFITPKDPRSMSGQWQRYYTRWRSMVRDRMDDAMLDLVEPLQPLATPANVFDKATYSAFGNVEFARYLAMRQARSLVLSGVETDVCVLATALDAVDRGFRVIVAADAVTSWSPAGHRAALDGVLPRFDQQIEIAATAEILTAWTKA